MKRWLFPAFSVIALVGAMIWATFEIVARSEAEVHREREREGAAFQRGRLAATCEHYCKDVDLLWGVLASPEIDTLEGHVVSVDDEEPRCRCMLADIPPREETAP